MDDSYWGEFWSYLETLVASSSISIDRPRGSHHPHYPDLTYPLDYGYLEGTHAADGSGVDVWVGSQSSRAVQGVALSVDLRKRDSEVKILIGCTQKEIDAVLEFMNTGEMRATLISREMDGFSLLETRRSVRRFRSEPVPRPVLEQVLRGAASAPSAHNRQPWRFAILDSPASRNTLTLAMGAVFLRDLLIDGLTQKEADDQVERSRNRILEAPVAVLLCLDKTDLDQYPDYTRQQASYLMGVQSVALAGGHLLLAAHALGLGGVWICAPLFAQDAVRVALQLPEEWEPQSLLLLGYPAKIPEPRQRRSLEEITRYL
jgi:F420 biosynthesis protein FbiB-like protein